MPHQYADIGSLDLWPQLIVVADIRVITVQRRHGLVYSFFVTLDSLLAGMGGAGPIRLFKAQLAFLAVLAEQCIMPVEAIQDILTHTGAGLATGWSGRCG